MTAAISHLPILILNVHSRCNCRCTMCDIWNTAESRELPSSFVDQHIDEFESLGVGWVVLTGGEPLMHSDLFRLCATLRSRGIRVTLLTSGLLLARYASEIAQHIDDLIVSIDGPPVVHDRIRGIKGAFDLSADGLARVRSYRPELRATCRCTVQKANHSVLLETRQATRAAGFDGISFLAADLTSTAFNRPQPWPGERQSSIALDCAELSELERQIGRLIAEHDAFVQDRPSHLQRIVHHFRAHLGLADSCAPRCNAPWVSAVIEPDGSVRPCFFHQPVGTVNGTLQSALNSPDALAFRDALDISQNATCRNCVCSLHRD